MSCKIMAETNKVEWEIDRVESYWYNSGRYCKTYTEVTFWYDPISTVRKETVRTFTASGNDQLPDWALPIQTRNRSLENY